MFTLHLYTLHKLYDRTDSHAHSSRPTISPVQYRTCALPCNFQFMEIVTVKEFRKSASIIMLKLCQEYCRLVFRTRCTFYWWS